MEIGEEMLLNTLIGSNNNNKLKLLIDFGIERFNLLHEVKLCMLKIF
jgi:hypothetical protein